MPVAWHVKNGGADTHSGSSAAVKYTGTTVSISGATVIITGDVTAGIVPGGDTIRLAGGTNGRYSTDIYVITAASYGGSETTLTVDASPNSPSSTGFTIGGPFATRQRALDVVSDAGAEEVRICGDIALTGVGDTGIVKRGAVDDGSVIRVIGCDASGVALTSGSCTLNMGGYAVHGFHDNNVARAGYLFQRLRATAGHASYYGWYAQNSSSYRWLFDVCSGDSMGNRAINSLGYGTIVRGGVFTNCLEPIVARGWISGVTCLDCTPGNAAITLVISIAGSGVSDCFIDRCRFGIFLAYASAGYYAPAIIRQCTITRSALDGIWSNTRGVCLVDRCALAWNGGYGISCVGTPTIYRRDCLYYQNTSGNVNSSIRGDDVGSVIAAPEFVSESRRNFRPRHGSPLVKPDGSYIGAFPASRNRRHCVEV